MNFVPCLTWVRRGVAKSTPEKLQLSQEELKKLIEETKADIKDTLADEDETEGSEHEGEERQTDDVQEMGSSEAADIGDDDDEEDLNARYKLDDYDDDESEMNPIFNIASLTLHADSKDDPFITVPDEEDEKEEIQDFNIQADDNLLVVGHVESDSSILEVYVYNKEEGDLYVHHDIVLPAYPLAIEWLDFHPNEDNPGNYVAVGDMTPVIKIWDLDVVDILEPYYKLGKKQKKKKAKKACTMNSGHTDAVLDLSWNKNVRNILASGSADRNICIWDLQEAKCMLQMAHHNDKVQSLKWHPSESEILLSGGCDGLVNLVDCRAPESVLRQWSVAGEVEKVLWNHFNSSYAFCSTDDGSVHCIDTRVDKLAYSIKAHNGAVAGMDLSSQHPGCLVTAGSDKCFKVWDVSNEPKFIVSKKMKLGSIYVAKSNPDYPFTFAFGGDNQALNLKMMDLMDIEECSEYYGKSSINLAKTEPQEPVPVSSSSFVPVMKQQDIKIETDHDIKIETDHDMDTDLNDSQSCISSSVSTSSHNTGYSPVKKSKRKNRFKNKKKLV